MANLTQNTYTPKSMPTATDFVLTAKHIHLKDNSGNTLCSLDRSEFEEWLVCDTDELVWPVQYQTEFGPVFVGTSTASLRNFWENYDPNRRLDRLKEFAAIVLSEQLGEEHRPTFSNDTTPF